MESTIIARYMNLESMTKIARDLNISPYVVRSALTKNGVEIRSRAESIRIALEKNIQISDDLSSVIAGELLGDGCLIPVTHQAYFSFENKNRDYTEYLAEKFINGGVDLQGRGIGKIVRTDPDRVSYAFKTVSVLQFLELEKGWYNERIKFVPKTIRINPIILLHWFMGDGTITQRGDGLLCTDCFTHRDQKRLSYVLNKTVGLTTHPMPVGQKFRIFIPRLQMPKMLDYIGECPIQSMEHKWRLTDRS